MTEARFHLLNSKYTALQTAYNEMNVNLHTMSETLNAMANRVMNTASPTHGRHGMATSPPQMEQPQMPTQPIQNQHGGAAQTPMVQATSLITESRQRHLYAQENGIAADGRVTNIPQAPPAGSMPFGIPARASDAQNKSMYGIPAAQQQQQQPNMPDARYMAPELHQAGMPQEPQIPPQPAAAGFGTGPQTPPDRRSAVPANFPDRAPQMPSSFANPAGQQQHAPQTAHQLTIRDFEPVRKENKQLTKSDGNRVHYKKGAERMTDHVAKGRRDFRKLLKMAQQNPVPPTKAILWRWNCSGVPALEMAEVLEAFLMEWVAEKIYDQRNQWCGGIGEESNGFKLWRKFHVGFHGSGDAMTLAGLDVFRKYPRHTKLEGLAEHLDGWEELLNTYASEMKRHTPTMLRSMLLNLIPTTFEDVIVTEPEILTYDDILTYCRKHTAYRRSKPLVQKLVNSTLKKTIGSRIHMLK